MPRIPIPLFTLTSLGVGYVFSSSHIPQLPQKNFFVAFAASWTVQLLAWLAWGVILYPKFFSPLRHLPEPGGGSWYNGQWKKLVDLPTGKPHIEW